MSDNHDSEVQNALLAIHARLGTIEGKINMVARAERSAILAELESIVLSDPLVAQVYLLLDGVKNQAAILEELARFKIQVTQTKVSRRMTNLVSEYGIADPVGRGTLRKNPAAEDVLNLSKRMVDWLSKAGETVPIQTRRRARAPKAGS